MKKSIPFSEITERNWSFQMEYVHGRWYVCLANPGQDGCVARFVSRFPVAPAVLMAGLWIVTTALAKPCQVGDVPVNPSKGNSMCVCVCVNLRCVQSPHSPPFSLVHQRWVGVWMGGQGQILVFPPEPKGFSSARLGTTESYVVQRSAFFHLHRCNFTEQGWSISE